MTVKEYYDSGNKLFTDNVELAAIISGFDMDYLDETALDVLDILFYDNLANCELAESTDTQRKLVIAANVYKNKELYDGIYKALTTEFDPLELVNIIESRSESRSGDTTKTGNETDSGTSSLTRTPNLTTETSPASTSEIQGRTFDDNTMRTEQKTINGGKDTTTNTGTETSSGTNGNTHTFNNVKDTMSEEGESETTRTGHDSIDYEKALASLYNTRLFNLLDRIIDDIAKEIVIPLFYF